MRFPRLPSLLLLTLLALWLSPAVTAHAWGDRSDKKDEGDEIDYLALAARLLRDGHADRAEGALRQVDRKQPKLDRRRFHTLRGLAALSQKHFAPAVAAFEAAIKAPPPPGEVQEKGAKAATGPDPSLLMYLAQSHFGQAHYAEALRALARAGQALDGEQATYLMRAQANWKLERPDAAIAALVAGAKRFPDEAQFIRTQVFYLVELGLFQRGTALGERYLARAEATAEDYIAVAEALRRGKQAERAGLLLEGAHLRFHGNPRILLALSHTYIDREQPLSAAILLEDAARLDAKYAIEAAEMYKRAGRLSRALSINARVDDQAAKFRQRLAILLEMERFELVGGMAPTLDRLGLLKDEQVRYALAYALYKVGDFKGAEGHLKRMTDVSLLDSANQLRQAMQACRADGWQCG